MKIQRYDRRGVIDIRRVRRLLSKYVRYWRKRGKAANWPATPLDGAARPPAALVRKFRKDQRRTQRQRNWERHVLSQ